MLGLTISERQMFIVPGKRGSENRKLRALLSTPIMNQKEQTGSAVRLLSSKPSPSDSLPPARLYHLKPPPKVPSAGDQTKVQVPGTVGDIFHPNHHTCLHISGVNLPRHSSPTSEPSMWTEDQRLSKNLQASTRLGWLHHSAVLCISSVRQPL